MQAWHTNQGRILTDGDNIVTWDGETRTECFLPADLWMLLEPGRLPGATGPSASGLYRAELAAAQGESAWTVMLLRIAAHLAKMGLSLEPNRPVLHLGESRNQWQHAWCAAR